MCNVCKIHTVCVGAHWVFDVLTSLSIVVAQGSIGSTPPDHILMTTTNMMIGWWWNSGEGCQTKIQDFNSSESFLSAFLLKRRNDDERLSIWVDCKAVSRASRKQRNPSAFTTSFFTVWQLTTVYYCVLVYYSQLVFLAPLAALHYRVFRYCLSR